LDYAWVIYNILEAIQMNFEVLTMVPIVGAGGSPEAIFPLGCCLELQSEQPNRKPLT
jgi:hypothetical protein